MVDHVPFTDIHMDQETVDDVADVLESGRYVKGPVLEQFESEFAAASEVDHAVGVSNGTAALLLAMKAIGVGSGDEVLAPAHTYFATVSPVLELGATPRFVDIDPDRYTMDPALLREAIQAAEDPATIVVTHMHGQPADMDPITDVAAEYDLPVVEDAAQAHLAEYDGEMVGSIGDVGCFSFYPTKNMTVGGDGGMITTDDPAIADEARALRNHGRNEKGEHVVLGLNYRLDEIKAAVGRHQLDALPDWSAGRQRAASAYDERLMDVDWVVTPTTYGNAEHVYHHYPVQVPADKRSAFRAHLDDYGVDTGIHYERAVHEQPAVRDRVGLVDVPVAEEYCRRTVSLPMHPRLSTEEIDHVVDAIESFEVDA
ncbi:dTDP-4-amino-4,6-dideoxygalactose transaminase [Halomicrobium zhouii]|uniref:dTDP-4-amino-4,6-dideoxygalactose transaminase n=2 Tax=Halomicrobium zhouii TaxID=767519 RepID=A0A1I6KG23_9EURY|nr:dTDP-4-amino-4,6-dideoxygalactose transaminase [Halomicrobium zhouii]